MSDKSQQPTLLGDILAKYQARDDGPPTEGRFGEVNKYISQEFQDYGYRLAVDLDDLKHKALYIKLAKTVDRSILERARQFAIDAFTANSRAKLFMWKMKELKNSVK